MRQSIVEIRGCSVELFSLNTVVVGSGAAGLNAADRLYEYGQKDIAVVTEGMNMGTSRNTGSDKQTYYKLTLAGGEPDSVLDMARTLFAGGCMHGDLALCEAALSAQSFYKLADIGVPFPHNRYGEYVGYKTDHDPRQRATSAGPLTSRFMTGKLETRVREKNIRIFDGYKVIGIITGNGGCKGLLALNKPAGSGNRMFTLFNCTNVIFATGGPAGLYKHSVYPRSQTGSSGIAFEAGVRGCNLTEWQYGIASTQFRWNLSGSYQQVLPRYVSTDPEGNDAREFLDGYFPDPSYLLNAIFLKGYQWPFDPRKTGNYGSSMIDVLVHREIQEKGRRVFLDYRNNPSRLADDLSNLGEESFTYLSRSGAFQSTPIERLAHINQPAIDLYLDNGINLWEDMLEIAVCAQHNNGGLSVDCWWETNIRHLFAVGEAAGTHGVYRPGGCALNSGQVGSTRAAMFIAKRYSSDAISDEDFMKLADELVCRKIALADQFMRNKEGKDVDQTRSEIGERMSKYAAHMRNPEKLNHVIAEAVSQLNTAPGQTVLRDMRDMVLAFENMDLLVAQYVYACAMADYAAMGGGSRGSYLVDSDPDISAGKDLSAMIQEVTYTGSNCMFEWKDVRPIPENNDWFENVWKEYRNDEYC